MLDEDGLNDLGQMINHWLPPGTGWILVMVPEHDQSTCTHCPIQTTSNLDSEKAMERVLTGAAGMFEHGTHKPLAGRPIEQVN